MQASGLVQINYLAGTIDKEEQMRLKKMVYRATRGKAYVEFFAMVIAKGDRLRGINDHENKMVYITTFEGGSHI